MDTSSRLDTTQSSFLSLEGMIIKLNNRKQTFLQLHSVYRFKLGILFSYQLLDVNIKFDAEFLSSQKEKRTKEKSKGRITICEKKQWLSLLLSQKDMYIEDFDCQHSQKHFFLTSLDKPKGLIVQLNLEKAILWGAKLIWYDHIYQLWLFGLNSNKTACLFFFQNINFILFILIGG